MPEPIPVAPRRDLTAADTTSLVRLGQADPPPAPAPATNPFLEPVYPDLPNGYSPSEPE